MLALLSAAAMPVLLRPQSPDIKPATMLSHSAEPFVAAATLPLSPPPATPAAEPTTNDDEPDAALIEALKGKDRLFLLRVGDTLEQLINDRRCVHLTALPRPWLT